MPTVTNWHLPWALRASQMAPVVKNPPANARDRREAGSVPGSGRSPGGGNGNPLQYSCLENLMDRGAWQVTAHGTAKSPTWLSDWALAVYLDKDWIICCYCCWPSAAPWKEFKEEIRNEALWDWEKPGKTGLQIVRYSQELVLWAQLLCLLISRKALKSFMVKTAPRD